MSTFKEANQARLSLKMKLSQFAWYNSSVVSSSSDDYYVLISVSRIDNGVRKIIPQVVNGVSIRTEL